MRLWNRRNETKSTAEDYEQQVAVAARDDLSQGKDPRCSESVGELLGWLWGLDGHKAAVIGAALTGLDAAPQWLLRLTQRDRVFHEHAPGSPAARYAAVVSGIRDYLDAEGVSAMARTSTGSAETVKPDRDLQVVLHIVARLRMHEVHEAVCDLLIAVNRAVLAIRNRDAYRQLQEEIGRCLQALPADHMPGFWRRVIAPDTEHCFYGIVARIRDRSAVTGLLEALPQMSADAASNVIEALRNIKDARAVLALQEIVADPQNLLAPAAERALSDILRNSTDEAAQLLRPSAAGHAAQAGILLRPAAASGATTRPDQLLRPGEQSPLEESEGP